MATLCVKLSLFMSVLILKMCNWCFALVLCSWMSEFLLILMSIFMFEFNILCVICALSFVFVCLRVRKPYILYSASVFIILLPFESVCTLTLWPFPILPAILRMKQVEHLSKSFVWKSQQYLPNLYSSHVKCLPRPVAINSKTNQQRKLYYLEIWGKLVIRSRKRVRRLLWPASLKFYPNLLILICSLKVLLFIG